VQLEFSSHDEFLCDRPERSSNHDLRHRGPMRFKTFPSAGQAQ
jgi:hypothetical protein